MRLKSVYRLLFVPFVIVLLGVLQFPKYGIQQVEPIGPYLNGVFPEALTDSTPAPSFLSQTGAFSNLETLEPSDGLIPYGLIAPFWSDGAIKTRWIAIPNDGTHDSPEEQVIFDVNNSWRYPEGSVTVKHFEMNTDLTNPSERRRLETRFVVQGPNEQFYYLTYKWNEEGTDAELLEGAETETLAIRTANGVRFQQWQYPSQENCVDCHRAISGSFLGPSTRQFNGDFLYPESGQVANQLATWNNLGIFTEPISESDFDTFITARAIDDESATLEERALTYLDTNCAYCHRPGSIRTSSFDARLTTPLDRSAIINGFVFNNNNIQNARVIAPGDTAKSLVYYRMRNIGNKEAMPPIAKAMIDSAGLQLMEDWILSLGSGVSTEEETAIPSELSLSIYPSPFTNQARIAYTLGSPESVTIDVFDATGRRVRQIKQGVQSTGSHAVELTGHTLASGTYIVRIVAGESSISKLVVRQ